MDPQVKSLLTSVGLGLASGVVGWAVAHGLVPSKDQAVLTNDLVTAASAAIAAGFAWWKTHQASPKGLVQSVGNTDPKKIAAAIDTAPYSAQATVVQVVNESKVLPSVPDQGEKK